MNKAANTYWTDARLAAQRPAARALTLVSTAHELPRAMPAHASAASRTEARRRGALIPSWVVFGMIILATFAVCVTVTMRAHAERSSAAQKYERMNTDVETLRNTNANIKREIERLATDRRAIEAAARARGMVRADELVVPVE
ncbi:MAG TPA: septum formation initiator family protein [Pyrinomonadaceae bacterium]|nr:septum formation initiator family protein [Pyrinomonadaceae bacterium]